MNRIPLNDPNRNLRVSSESMLKALELSLHSGYWLNGPNTARFCQNFASYVGVSHCVGVSNGSDALEIALRALLVSGKAKGDELVTVPNAGGYSSIAAFQVGLKPIYADVDLQSQLISISSLLSCLSERTAAVAVTHLYGGVVDVPLIRASLDEGFKNVPILEDCAQAHGAKIRINVFSFGDIATFSFYPTKNLGAWGDAGAIVSDDYKIIENVRSLAQYGWSNKYTISVPGGRNSRIDELQAAYLDIILQNLDHNNARRAYIYNRYLESLPDSITLVEPQTSTVAHLAVLLVEERDRLRDHLSAYNITSDIHYPILDIDQPGWLNLPMLEGPNGIPVARASVSRLLTIPCFPGITEVEIDRVCSALSSFT